MEINLHNLECYSHESIKKYHERLADSRRYAKKISSGKGEQLTPFRAPHDNPNAKPSRAFWFTGQNQNPDKNKIRKLKRQIGARQFRKRMKAERTSLRQSGETR